MSIELILIITGSILSIVAVFDLLSIKIRIPVGILGIILVIYGGYSYGAINLQGQIEQVEIDN